MSGRRRLEARVAGTVQGVGFRFFVERAARRLGVDGWVRNTAGGDVELAAEGDEAALRELLELCRQGPRSAHVRAVQVNWTEATGESAGFHIRG